MEKDDSKYSIEHNQHGQDLMRTESWVQEKPGKPSEKISILHNGGIRLIFLYSFLLCASYFANLPSS